MPGDGLAVGRKAPAVGAPLVHPDGQVEERSIAELVADGPVLLCFYVADFTPDCVRQWCAFRDFDWFGADDRVRVVGASRSDADLHRRFIDRLGIGFPLYADVDLRLAAAFDVVHRALGALGRARRSCFLLDEQRTVRYRWPADDWLDSERERPPVREIYGGVREALDLDDPETFGF